MCPDPYFGVNSTTNYYCTQYCPTGEYKYVSDDGSVRMCVDVCPDGYFGDSLTMACVEECPDYHYGNPGDNLCILDCQPLYADDSLKQCVEVCVDEGTTASNTSYHCQDQCDYGEFELDKVCETGCPEGHFADNLTRKC